MWHQPRLRVFHHNQPQGEGILSQPVIKVVINKTHTLAKKTGTGVTCQLYEARRTVSILDLSKFLEKITEIDPTCRLAQTCEINNIDNTIPTKFGYSPSGSFASYQLAFSESNFIVTTSFKPESEKQIDSGSLPKFPSLPVDDFNDNFTMNIPEDLNQQQQELLDGLKLLLV